MSPERIPACKLFPGDEVEIDGQRYRLTWMRAAEPGVIDLTLLRPDGDTHVMGIGSDDHIIRTDRTPWSPR